MLFLPSALILLKLSSAMADPNVVAWLRGEGDDLDPPLSDAARMLQLSMLRLREMDDLESIDEEGSDHEVLENMLQRMEAEPEDSKGAHGKAGAKAHGKAGAKAHGKVDHKGGGSNAFDIASRQGHTGYKPGCGKSFSKFSGQSENATSSVGLSDNVARGAKRGFRTN